MEARRTRAAPRARGRRAGGSAGGVCRHERANLRSLHEVAGSGVGEGGGKTALPIWLEYMKFVHEGIPEKNFRVPEGITFANIDNETGKLATASTEKFVRQAFLDGTEPKVNKEENKRGASEDIQDFFKQDLSE